MGMYSTTIVGIGSTKKEAQADAEWRFYDEEGHSHDIREIISAEQVASIAPMKWVTRKEVRRYGPPVTYQQQVTDLSAPKEQWLQEWKFKVWVHH